MDTRLKPALIRVQAVSVKRVRGEGEVNAGQKVGTNGHYGTGERDADGDRALTVSAAWPPGTAG
jgi:hypothetical protein